MAFLCKISRCFKGVPSHLVYGAVVYAFPMTHDQLDIITTACNAEVLDYALLECAGQGAFT
jgi:hypothetical protein